MKNKIWGIILIIVGFIFAVNTLGIAHINIFFDGWWTLFIIVPCTIDLFTKRDKVGNIFGIAFGLALLGWANGMIDLSIIFKLIVPAILVTIGLSVLIGDKNSKAVEENYKKIDNGKLQEYAAVFAEQKINLDGLAFEGARLDAEFGALTLDLRKAKIKQDQIIDATAIFGGIDIIVPENVNVIHKSNALFGGTSNRSKRKDDNKVTIYIDAKCLFGGVEIK